MPETHAEARPAPLPAGLGTAPRVAILIPCYNEAVAIPRVIADDLWAKLLWAGLNLTDADLVTSRNARNCYPVELVRAWPSRGCSAAYVAMRSSACALDVSGGSRAPMAPIASACSRCPPTRPARRSPSPSIPSSARPSKRGKLSVPPNRVCSTCAR